MPVSVCYIVSDADADAAVAVYSGLLDFHVGMQAGPAFASLSRGDLRLLINRPGAGGAGTAMPDGQVPASGGWNRFMLEYEDLEVTVASLRTRGARFRNDIVVGNGGKQILIEDPAGNAIELFQPAPH